MRVRHRLSKLIFRQWIIFSGGTPWTGIHELRLRQKHLYRGFPALVSQRLRSVSLTNRLGGPHAVGLDVGHPCGGRAKEVLTNLGGRQ